MTLHFMCWQSPVLFMGSDLELDTWLWSVDWKMMMAAVGQSARASWSLLGPACGQLSPGCFVGHLGPFVFPGGASGKEPACQWRRLRKVGSRSLDQDSLIPGSRKSAGGGHSSPLQYSCLENPVDRGAWWATVHGGHKESGPIEVT